MRVSRLIYSLFFSNLAAGYLSVVITAFLPEIGFGYLVGLLVGVSGIVLVLTGIPLGILSDRRGRRSILILGSLGVPVAVVLFALTSSAIYFIISAVLLGLSSAASLTTWNAVIADQTTPENRDSFFAQSFIVSTTSSGIGYGIPLAFPLLESFLKLDSYTVHKDFLLVFGLLSLLTPIWLYSVLRDYREVNSHGRQMLSRENRRRLIKFSGINSLIGLGAGLIIPLIATWLFYKFSITDTLSGPLLALSNITIGFAAVVSPKLSKRYGLPKAIVMTQASSTIFMLSCAYVPSFPSFAGVYLIRTALMNMANPLSDSFLMGIMTKEDRGLASAINSLIWRMPNSVTTIIGGALITSGQFELPFLLATGFYVVSIALFYGTFRDVKPLG